jgi:hypothetical protein
MTLMRHRLFNRSWKFASLLVASLLAGLSGCAMCCAPFDYDYGYQGGAWVRDNPTCGRVGSVFEPAGYKAIADRASEPTPAEAPAIENLDQEGATPESMEPMPMPPSTPNMITAPRMRSVQNYLPQN